MDWKLIATFTVIELIIRACFELLPIRSKSRHIATLMDAEAKARQEAIKAAKAFRAEEKVTNAIRFGIQVGQQMAYDQVLTSLLPGWEPTLNPGTWECEGKK